MGFRFFFGGGLGFRALGFGAWGAVCLGSTLHLPEEHTKRIIAPQVLDASRWIRGARQCKSKDKRGLSKLKRLCSILYLNYIRLLQNTFCNFTGLKNIRHSFLSCLTCKAGRPFPERKNSETPSLGLRGLFPDPTSQTLVLNSLKPQALSPAPCTLHYTPNPYP